MALNGQREDQSHGLFLVIKRQGKRDFFPPLFSAKHTRKTERNREKGEEKKKGKRREEKGKKKEESLGVFYLKVCSWFVWFLLVILMVE